MRTRIAAAACFVAVFTVLASAASVFGQAKPVGANDELLGFSRYLPADTRGYVSALQLGKVRKDVAASNAWAQVEALPEVRRALAQLQLQLESKEAPPPIRTAIALLKSAGESEISLASSGDSSNDVMNLIRAVLLSVAVIAPSPHDPDTLQGQVLETKRAPLRAEWTQTVPKVRLPSLVVAARVKDHEKYQAFVEAMLDLGWQYAEAEIDRNSPPPAREPLKKAYSRVKVGNISFARFRLRLGDIIPEAELARGIDRIPLDDDGKHLVHKAIADLSVDAHLGFVGEYLTLSIGADDRFITQIVERYEGRATDTLAASDNFANVRAELSPTSLAIVYAESTEFQREMQRSFLPLVNKLADPELHALLGAPADFTATVSRVQYGLETAILSTPLKQESLVTADHGLKQYLRLEYDRKPVAAPTMPLATLAMVPERAIGYSILRHGTAEPLRQELKSILAQERARCENLLKLGGDRDDDFSRHFKAKVVTIDSFIKTLDGKFAESLQGEMAVVLGGFSPFYFTAKSGVPIRDITVPTVALLVHTESADRALAGVGEIFTSLFAAITPKGATDPIVIDKVYRNGFETWSFSTKQTEQFAGIEPHFTRVGGALVFSTSYRLTQQMRDTLAGKSRSVTTGPTHQAMQQLLPVGASQAMFIDGAALSAELRTMSESIFALLEKEQKGLRIGAREQESIAAAKPVVQLGLSLIGCLRGAASSTVGEGRFDVIREWVHLEDLKPAGSAAVGR